MSSIDPLDSEQVRAASILAMLLAPDPDALPAAISRALHHIGRLDGGKPETAIERRDYEDVAENIKGAIDFMRANLPPVESADGGPLDRVADKLTRDYHDGPFGVQPWRYADSITMESVR